MRIGLLDGPTIGIASRTVATRPAAAVLVLGLAACLAAGCGPPRSIAREPEAGIVTAISALERAGAKVVFDFEAMRDANAPQRESAIDEFKSRSRRGLAPKAVAVFFDRVQVSDAQLVQVASLRDLRRLNIEGGDVTDAGLAPLADLRSLEEIRLLGCPGVRGPGLRYIASLPALRTLNLGGTPVGNDGLALLVASPRLSALIVNSALIDDGAAVSLSRMDLGELFVDGTAMTGKGLASLGCLPGLHTLALGRRQLDGPGLTFLAHCPNVKHLWIHANAVAGSDLEALRQARPDLVLHVARTSG